MKKIKEIKSSKTPKGSDVDTKRNDNSAVDPKEFEEQRSMDIRMKPQPFPSSEKPEKKKPKK